MTANEKPKARILIVDDEPSNRELLSAFLYFAPYELEHAASGPAALAAAKARPPDLVILDVMMPGMDGFDVTRHLKEAAGTDYLPIVLVTALGDSRARLRGYEAGADEFLQKPVDRSELLARVRNLLALRADRRALSEQNKHLLRLKQFRERATSLMVHDLKNPLAAIGLNMGFAQSQLRQIPGTEEVQGAIEDARLACARLHRLINELLDISRMEEGRLELRYAVIDTASLLQAAAKDFEFRAREENIHLAVSALPANLEGDGELVTRVTQSLLENAFKFTPAGGRVEVASAESKTEVEIRVSCDAPPLPLIARETAFQKNLPGLEEDLTGAVSRGAGLYYCRLVAEAHGGRAELTDQPGFSTSFRLVFPLKRLEAPAAV